MKSRFSYLAAAVILVFGHMPVGAEHVSQEEPDDNCLIVKTIDVFGLLGSGDPITITPLPGFARNMADNGKKGRNLEATYVAEDPNSAVMLLASVPNTTLTGEPVDVPYAKFLDIKQEVESDPSKALTENDRAAGIRACPIHADDNRSFQFTATKEFRDDAPDGGVHTIVMSNTAIWAKGRFFQLAAIGVADATSVSNVVEITRKLADNWYRAVAMDNTLPDSDSPEFMREKEMADLAIQHRKYQLRQLDEELMRDKERNLRKIKRKAAIEGKFFTVAVFGIISLIVAAFRKERGRGRTESVPQPSPLNSSAEEMDNRQNVQISQDVNREGTPDDVSISPGTESGPVVQSITGEQADAAGLDTERKIRLVVEKAGPEAVAAMSEVRRVARVWRQRTDGGRIFCDIVINYDDAEGNLQSISVPAGIWGDGWIGIGPKRISPERFGDNTYMDERGHCWGRIYEDAKPDPGRLAAFLAKYADRSCHPPENAEDDPVKDEKASQPDQTSDGNAGCIAGAVLLIFIAIMVVANADSDSLIARIAMKGLVAGVVGAIVGAVKGSSRR